MTKLRRHSSTAVAIPVTDIGLPDEDLVLFKRDDVLKARDLELANIHGVNLTEMYKHSMFKRDDGDHIIVWVARSFIETEDEPGLTKRQDARPGRESGFTNSPISDYCRDHKRQNHAGPNGPYSGGVQAMYRWARGHRGGRWDIDRNWENLVIAGSNNGANAVYKARVIDDTVASIGTMDVRNDADWTQNRAPPLKAWTLRDKSRFCTLPPIASHPKMKPTSFLDFPQEIQLQIAEDLPHPLLARLSMTCRSLNSLAEPLLYSTIQISWVREYYPPILKSLCLIRTLLEKPELCNYVRSLEFHGDDHFDRDDPPDSDELPEPPRVPVPRLDRLATFIEATGVEEASAVSWINNVLYCDAYEYLKVPEFHQPYNELYVINKVHEKWADGTVALLLCLLPNLSKFSASRNWIEDSRTLEAMFRLSLCPTTQDRSFPSLQSLKEVSIASTIENGYPNLDPENTAEALSTFYLPKLQSLSVSIDNPVQFTWPGSSPPDPAFLTSLDIYRLRECYLAPILSVTRGLKRLRYDWHYRPDLDIHVNLDTILLDTMAEAFLEVSDTLEELRITAWVAPAMSQGMYDPPDITFRKTLAQISRMKRLKTLHVPWAFLIGWDILPTAKQISHTLPTTLQHLTLNRDLMGVRELENPDKAMVSALEWEFENGTPLNAKSLKSICLPQSFYRRGGWSKECRERLEVLESRSGLTLTFDPNLPSF
ncbi:hypothetical protein FIE12Z_6733 [Fusarium flagelliforme]|uniref:F-box domain-containing protein n=1 Tax=Fusarium flagelliforme TaxID=2675880 RepID=A0A395MMG0_9HYPO|nr:hypothetical protein FIE12Z_6733 [Fusarium flagelliforme]